MTAKRSGKIGIRIWDNISKKPVAEIPVKLEYGEDYVFPMEFVDTILSDDCGEIIDLDIERIIPNQYFFRITFHLSSYLKDTRNSRFGHIFSSDFQFSDIDESFSIHLSIEPNGFSLFRDKD